MTTQVEVAAIAARLGAIAATHSGRLTPEAVLADAAALDSPLHGEFEWDDSVAAVAHRLDQARGLIRRVRVMVTTESRTLSTVAYVRDPTAESDEQGYVSTLSLRNDGEKKRAALQYELSRAHAALARVRDLGETWGLTNEVNETLQSIDALQQRVNEEVPVA